MRGTITCRWPAAGAAASLLLATTTVAEGTTAVHLHETDVADAAQRRPPPVPVAFEDMRLITSQPRAHGHTGDRSERIRRAAQTSIFDARSP